MNIIGKYNKNGYTIENTNGVVLYSAGANAIDSTAPGINITLSTIQKYCVKTGKEIAKEQNSIWSGTERIPENE